ncbi:hypothetical protein [Acinetobacter sp. TSRC1-2]|uniref:hypothetical protein n=1 Tax=unclassified Acinetobacter TaxID=196816 RepID=UPI003CF14746
MANENQTSLRILQPSKKIIHPPAFYGILGFCTGVVFSSIVGYVYLNTLIHNEIDRNLRSINTHYSEQALLEKKQQFATGLENHAIPPDIQINQPVQDEEHPVEFPQPQEDDLSKVFIHQDQPRSMVKSLNKTPVISKETAVSP